MYLQSQQIAGVETFDWEKDAIKVLLNPMADNARPIGNALSQELLDEIRAEQANIEGLRHTVRLELAHHLGVGDD